VESAGLEAERRAAEGLVRRVAGPAAWRFRLELVDRAPTGPELMGLGADGGSVVLRGTSGVSLAAAFNWYLNDYLNTTYDWSTYEAVLPPELPLPTAATKARVVNQSYYLNVCTYGYSLAFVDWPYWEKHIDWMAMQGVNLPLAFLGQERVLELTFRRFNVSGGELRDFISGPAFLPWFRMGNLQGWGGPITRHWIDSRVSLQRRVLARMRSLGMTPVLPAFAGFLPSAFVGRHPQARVARSQRWNNFPDPYGAVYVLEPTDPMFTAIGRAFVQEQASLYGTDHIYQCDTYNEMQPASSDLKYLASSSRAVFSAMQAGDSQALWLMQGWLFLQPFWTHDRVHAYLGSVPDDRMWILDLDSATRPIWSSTDSYYGKGFFWNTLHNFGGQQGFTGDLPSIRSGFGAALKHSPAQVRGVGITMEGIWTNYIVFDYTLSLAWGRAGAEEPRAWAARYGARRYGARLSEAAAAVWQQLYDVAYAAGGQPRSGQLAMRPALEPQGGVEPRPVGPIAAAWRSLLGLAGGLPTDLDDVPPPGVAGRTLRFDLVDVGREALTAVFDQRLGAFRRAVAAGDAASARAAAPGLLEVLRDLEALLATDENFLLGAWLSRARSWGATEEERRWLDFNARNQVTLWGPSGEINDYATKTWAGLVGSYFAPRWELFLRRVLEALAKGVAFNGTAFNEEVLHTVEQPWQNATGSFPSQARGSAVGISSLLVHKYASSVDPLPLRIATGVRVFV